MSWTKRTPSKDPARHSENESSWAPRRDWQRGASPIPVSARWVCSAGAGSGRLRHQQPDNRSSAVIVSRDRRADRRFGVGLVANLAPAPIAMPVDHRAIAALAFSCRWRRGRRVPASGSAGFPDRCGDARGRYTRRHFPCAALPCREIRPVRDSSRRCRNGHPIGRPRVTPILLHSTAARGARQREIVNQPGLSRYQWRSLWLVLVSVATRSWREAFFWRNRP